MYLKTNTKPGDANSLRSYEKKISVNYLFFSPTSGISDERFQRITAILMMLHVLGDMTPYRSVHLRLAAAIFRVVTIFLFDYPEYVDCKQYKDHDTRLSVT